MADTKTQVQGSSTEWTVSFSDLDGKPLDASGDPPYSALMDQTTMVEVTLSENLLTPGLQTTIVIDSGNDLTDLPVKNLDLFYNSVVTIAAKRDVLADEPIGNQKFEFNTTQRVYRLDQRKPKNYQAEQFSLQACDPSLLKDAQTWVNAGWQCTSPSDISTEVMRNCLNLSPRELNIESSYPPRDFISENLHPFQVIRKQAEAALAWSKDPSYIHYMTYQNDKGEDIPTHNFRSLRSLSQQDAKWTYIYSDKVGDSTNYSRPTDIMKYESPCDFDLLSDLMNGYNENGDSVGSIVTRALDATIADILEALFGQSDSPMQCSGVPDIITDQENSLKDSGGCLTIRPEAIIYRPARMAILDKDKIAMRVTIPFNPQMNVGRTINLIFPHKSGNLNYGSGKYMITGLLHNLKSGGFGVTVMDCVANTVASGKTGVK